MKRNLIPVEGDSSLFRDSTTKAIINDNKLEYDSYLSRKKFQEKESDRIEDLENDFDSIKTELNEIKSLLKGLAERSI
jgi:hypothetical protein|tara:strand:- start:957 stop:1190 length:234 start_codon:yes stop_codon:yes gene_type:complete